MSGLLDIPVPVKSVQVADKTFDVRGLSPNDALSLYYRHAVELSALYDQFAGKVKAKMPVLPSEILEAGAAMVSGTPRMMAEIIALAAGANPADDETYSAIIDRLVTYPAGVQMDALNKIGELTFTSEMPLGKFVGLVLAMVQSTKAIVDAPKT